MIQIKRESGFTLVELLGVIVIIGVLSLISVPIVEKSIKESKQESYNRQLDNIKMAMIQWQQNHQDYFVFRDNNYTKNNSIDIYLTVSELKGEGLIPSNIKDARTNSEIPNDLDLKISKDDEGYHYDVLEKTGTETDEYDDTTPYIIPLNGKVKYVDIGSKYNNDIVDLYLNDGTVSKEVSVNCSEISGKGTDIDTSVPGTYYIKYNFLSNEINTAYIQTVIVMDISAPVFNVDGYFDGMSVGSSYDFMTGITAMDNVDGNVTANITMNDFDASSFDSYMAIVVKYTVEDSNGNVATMQLVFEKEYEGGGCS